MSIEPANLCVTNQPICHNIPKTAPSTVDLNGENGEVKL